MLMAFAKEKGREAASRLPKKKQLGRRTTLWDGLDGRYGRQWIVVDSVLILYMIL